MHVSVQHTPGLVKKQVEPADKQRRSSSLSGRTAALVNATVNATSESARRMYIVSGVAVVLYVEWDWGFFGSLEPMSFN